MKKKYKQIFILIFLIAVLLLPYFVFAQTPLVGLEGVRGPAGYAKTTETSMAGMVGTVINAFLSILGVIFLVLTLFAGYSWMTAGGDEAKVDKAKNTIGRAIIGLIITVSSWAIYNFIFLLCV
ncbi:MAG: hypothetical protein U9Q85_02390 [Patescibacteria group bacterium]|nr:hypothetical protein [Patescibacteria group bacterium]